MIHQNLHRRPTALDGGEHRLLRLRMPTVDWSVARGLNAVFVAAAETGDACREFPLVFVRAGKDADGTDAIALLALMGLVSDENLFVEGNGWRGRYVPAVLRSYPFCVGRIDDERFAICVDMGYEGFSVTEGQPLFDDKGQPAELLQQATRQLETLEGAVQRTRQMCKRLAQLDVLQDMRFDVTMPGGRQHTVDGFLGVDEKKMNDLPDDVVCELHRSGVLGLVQLHWASMGNMSKLAEWHAERHPASASGSAPTAANDASPAA